ncbi:hypothetical protein Tsubulata_018494 [Turnera subulata]|uniref:C2H2-type domain-containing protein n=1 Tax=Turnera subulata TaxID=218843 RepID=A0A9Q0G4S5_9ROSI|nr:hypothetical protein Tsubulata_018494 [Turnera subulata]
MNFWGVQVKGGEPCKVEIESVRVNLESQDAERKPIVQMLNTSGSKQKVKVEEPNKYCKLGGDTDDSSDDEEDNDYQDMVINGEGDSGDDEDDDESDEDDDDSDEDEETPKKVELSKKRSVEPAKRTLVPDKKAKFVTPQKTDGPKKVGGHTATPYPSKKPAKLLATSFPKNDQSPKSFACYSCKRSFGSENALQSHSKAKHGAS